MAEHTTIDHTQINQQQLDKSMAERMNQPYVSSREEMKQILVSFMEKMNQPYVSSREEMYQLYHSSWGEKQKLAGIYEKDFGVIRYVTLTQNCYNTFQPSEPGFTPKQIRNLVLERIASLEKDQRLTVKEKRCKDQIVKDEVNSSQYDYFGRQTAMILEDVNAVTNEISPMHQRANETDTSSQNDSSKRSTASIKDGVMLLQDKIRYIGNNQILDANRIDKQKICIEETAGRMIDVVNDLTDEIRCKGMIEKIEKEVIRMELDIIRKSTANLKDTVKALIEEIRHEHHMVDDGDIAEELGFIQWLIAELMDALKRLRTAMRQNQLDLKPVGIKRKLNIVVIKREVSGDDAQQRLNKTKHIATYDLAAEKRPTYGTLSAVLCELCINENEAVNWCETCNSNICVSCTCFHKDVRMMTNHRIFNLP